MTCARHPDLVLPVVCGEEVCGACYGEALLAEPVPTARQRPELEHEYDSSVHRKMLRRKRGKSG